MNLIHLLRKLQTQLHTSESLAARHQKEAEDIRAKLADVSRILGSLGVRVRGLKASAGQAPAGRRRRAMSAKARASISRAQKARWAAWRAKHGKKGGKAKAAPRKKRHLSPEGRARIRESLLRRWAEYRANKAKNA